jgi:hypothetical protein
MNVAGINHATFAGQFRESEFGKHFDFFATPENAYGMPHMVDTGNEEFRFARVLKTVAHIVTSEDDEGNAIIERWNIRQV